MKHTKGKWEAQCQVDDPTVYNDERCEGEEFDVYAVSQIGGSAKSYALIANHISGGDANLIASAPKMLEMVKEIVQYVEGNGLDKMSIEEGSAEYFTCTLYWHFAKDLLARAEGETEKAIIMEEARLFPDEE